MLLASVAEAARAASGPLLAYAIFSEGVRNVVAGASAVELKRDFDAGRVPRRTRSVPSRSP